MTIVFLEEIEDLSRSRFGQPSPRHGLELLFWFAKEYIIFDNNNQIVLKYDPKDGHFGFHRFQNRIDNIQDDRLLPTQTSPYYEVGNLHSPGASYLPFYVRKKFTNQMDGSNTDRIIIGSNSDGAVQVYVTQHEDQRNFSHDHTCRISDSLLYEIHNISSCEIFLENVIGTGKLKDRTRQRHDYISINMDSNFTGQESESCCPCTIL